MNTQYPLCTFLSAPSWKKPWNLACGLLLAMVCWLPMHAQISYTQAWNTAGNLGGWTFSSGSVDATGTPCEGASGARVGFSANQGALTWTLTSPNVAPPLGNSGSLVTTTFQFKRSTTSGFNYMRSYWSTDNSTWTQVAHSVSNQSCNSYTMSFTPPAGQPVYIRLQAARNQVFFLGTAGNYLFDNVAVSQTAPICPAATVTVVENCANGNYSVQFDVTSIGNGGSLAYSVNGVSQAPLSIPAIGIYTIGPFPTTQQVNYTLTNSLSTTVCGSVTGARWSTCPVNITCGTTLNVQHCYTNNDDRSFHFVAPPGETITLDFVAGTMGSGDVIRAYSGGDDTGTPIGSLTGNYANLPGVGGMSMSNELYLEVESNASGSCSDGQQTSWQFEVKCTPACTSPDGAVSPITNCTASNYSLNVEVISTGDEPTTTLWYSVDGGPPQTIPGLVEWNIQPIGPFPLTSSVNVRLLHATQNSCDRNLGNFTRDQLCPPANELCGQATQLFVKTPAQCPGEATNGTTFDANNEIAAPTCNGTGGTIRDVWYRFNSGFNQSPIQIAIAAGTIGHWGLELYSACGGTPISCTTGSPAAVNLSGATAFTDYWVRVLTNTSLGAMGTFSICVSATPQPSSCGNTIRDPGGAANYPNNANVTTTYCPTNPGEVLTMTFTQFSVESGFGDELKVYNGPSTASPLVGTFSGTSIPAPIVSSHPSGCLTTNFTSGAFFNQAGYTANLTCCIAPPPTVSAGNNGPLCPGVPANLNLTATSNIGTVFSWTGPNGFSSTQQNPTITGAGSTAAGTYTVTASNGASGCPTSATTTVVLNPTISAAATASPAQVCPGGTATLNSLAGYANNYAVSSTPFGLLSGSGTSVVTGDDAVSSAIALPFGFEFFGTTYNQVFAYTNGWLQLGTSSGSTATYSTTLPATAGPNTLIAALWDDLNVTGGGTVTSFTAGTAPNRVFVVSWNNVKFYNAAANDGNATFQIQLFESDMHVEVHIAEATDPVASAKTVGVENQTGTVGFTPPGRNNATFSVAPATPEAWAFRRGGTFTYAWTPSVLVNSPATASTTTAALTSTTTFSVVVSDGTCSVTRTADVTVGTGIASAAISPAVPPAICAGGSVTLTASGTGGVPPYTYVWSPGGETTASINATAAGAYSCVVTDQCGTSATAPAVTMVVVTPPTTASAGAPQAICTNGSAVLAANAPVNGTGAWSMVSGPSTSLAQFSSLSASNATFTPAGGAGTYTLRWTISNAPCTASTSDVVITVNVSTGNPTVGTSSLAICQGGTVPSGQGLSATCPTVAQAGSTPFPGSNFTSEGATITTRATVTVPALPAGAVVTAARLRLTNVVAANNILGSAQRQNIRVALSGAYTLAEVQLTTATGPGTVSPDPVITLAGFPASGGSINLRTRQTTDNLFTNPDATIGGAVIEVDYTMPSQVRWYNAPTAGTLVFTGGLFDPVGQGAVNNTVPGSTTFHATCGFNACEAIRLPATFTVNPLPTATLNPNGPFCGSGAPQLTGTLTGTGPWSITYTTNGGSPVTVNAIASSPFTIDPTGPITSTTTYAITAISDANCAATSFPASVQVVVNTPATANAGGPYTTCGTTAVNITASSNGTGSWSGGAGTFGSTTSASTTYTPDISEVGTALTLTWTTDDPDGVGPCASVSSTAPLQVTTPPTAATVGGPQLICANTGTTSLGGNTPSLGTGTWSIVSGGTGTFSDANDPNSTFTHTGGAGPIVLRWTITGTAPCTSSTADVSVTINTTDSDGDGVIDCLDNCPTLFGQNGDACNAGPNFVLGQIVNCACVGQQCTTDLIVEFQTDANGFQNTWELRTTGTNILVQSGGGWYPGGAVITDNTCLPDGCYYLRVFDAGGDGMANGGYILRTTSGQRIIDNRNNFNSGGLSAVINNGGFCLPLGGDKLIYTSCDKLDWMNNQFLVAAENAAVSAQWQVGDQTDDGYQFWIFDPNGTYGYAKFRNHATSDGFGPASATRACHMQINNWSPDQIPANVLMNAKVRSRVNGTNSAWGPVCRFKIDPVRAACPLTKLMDIPGNVNYSCGVTRTWGASSVSKVVARPVDGATQYQFRWRSAELASPVVRTTTTPVLQLNWTPALPNGDYDVEVRVFKNNQWCVTGPAPGAWGDVCRVTIVGSPVGQGMAPQATGSTRAAELAMFPNPNRGDLLTLSLSAVEEGVNTVSVDIYDLTGAVVSSRTIAVNDGMVYQVLELTEMASGLYMVNITAGNDRYTERLVISK